MKKEKILYIKYSNDRAAAFRIATQIIERDGKKIVRKNATEESSRSHVLAMKKHKNALNDMFSGTKFRANNVLASGEDFVDFEYLEGKSYDQLLDDYLKNKDMDGFYSAVRVFFDELDKLATVDFHASEKAKEIFGENAFIEGEKAFPVGNIDQTFQNVLVDSEGKWNVIDYEWTFDFAVPVRFLKCRILLIYFFASSNRFVFFTQELLVKLNLTENYFELCKKIEQTSFTKYVHNNHSQLSDFASCLRKNMINPYVLEHQDYIDVFYDTGNGFSEAEKDTFFQFPVTITPKENIRSLRIDPSAHCCIVNDISIKAENTELSFSTNAYMQKNDAYFFNTQDPQIYVDDIKGHEKSTFICDMKVFALDETTSATIANQNTTIVEQNTTIADQNTTIADQNTTIVNLHANVTDLRTQLESKQREIDSIYASQSWKLTKPLRLMGGIARQLRKK